MVERPEREDATLQGGGRQEYESLDIDDVEEVPSSADLSDDIGIIEVDLDDGNVDKLLAMTGENWSIDTQRETLKEAAKDGRADVLDSPDLDATARPSLHIPTPSDFGGRNSEPALVVELEDEFSSHGIVAAPQPKTPPPLPSNGGAGQPRSMSPPPLPPHRPAASSGSVRPPILTAPTSPSRRPSRPPLLSRPSQEVAASGPVTFTSSDPPRMSVEGHALVELLTARIARIQDGDDRVGLARAHVELAVVHETLGDDAQVNSELDAALAVDPHLAPAHAIFRRRIHQRTELPSMLQHLEREIEVVSGEALALELLVERARLLVAGDRTSDAREAWELVLARAPNHSAALKGLETELARRAFEDHAGGGGDDSNGAAGQRWEDLATHLVRMADAYSAQPNLAAWLHVERAKILELRLGNVDGARGAYERALRLDGSVGPVRHAFTLHCAAHHDMARLAELFAEEARLETSSSRCARLELSAACLLRAALGDDARAATLLERAAGRAPTTPSVDRRVLDELVLLHESSGQWEEAARARRLRLRFFTDASTQIYEWKRLSAIEEKLGNIGGAIDDIQRALAIDPDDATLVEELDRVLSLAGNYDERIALWHREAQRVEEGSKRAHALAKAAELAEAVGRHDVALRHLRAAWVTAPGNSEVLDPLSRLMSIASTEEESGEVRGLIELYSQAAATTHDAGRRVAYLEKIALLWEELVGDQLRAARTFEEILRLDPNRRGALLGLERTAGRIGDARALAQALEGEAKLAEDGVDVLALRVRAAEVLSRVDPARAANLVAAVLEQDSQHVAARALETRLHEDAGRWELAAQSLKARLEIAVTTKEKVSLWLELARIYDVRLRDAKSAVEALREARKADPIHPVPPEEIARILSATGDAKTLRAAIEQLAVDAITPQERARHLMHAAELDELRLMNDLGAKELYTRALAETPDDELIADRLVHVLARRTFAGTPGASGLDPAAFDEFIRQVESRSEFAASSAEARAYSFELASLLVATNGRLSKARGLLEKIHDADPHHVGVLRLLETIARQDGAPQTLALVLKFQGEHFTDVRARVGALWGLASLEAWRLSAGESIATYTRILELDPTDPSALEAAVRLTLGPARRGDVAARRAAIAALRSLSLRAHDDATRIATGLRLGLILEAHSMDPTTERDAMTTASREALDRLREVVSLDPLSVSAATSLARVANRLGDASGAAVAAISLAELSVQPKVRAKYLIDAANLLLGDSNDEALGPRTERLEHAAQLLEKALDSDPNSKIAATRLSQVRSAQDRGERLVDVFRSAIARATATDTIVYIGTEIARVARDELDDVGVAIESMRAVRIAAPDHVPSLLTLSDLFIAQRAWPEAVEILEEVVDRGKDVAPRVTALFALARIYEKVLGDPSRAEQALRMALGVEPENPRSIRALIHRLAAKQNEPAKDGLPHNKTTPKLEIASLLDRLAHVEKDRVVKCDILLELADIRIALKDPPQAENALVEAVATAPDHPRAFARLSRFFRSPENPGPGGLDAVSYARALAAVIGRGQQLGTSDPRWFASLGHIEVEQLNRLRDGVGHLQRAVQMDPNLHECRFELATAFSRLGAHEDASTTVLSMLVPSAKPLVSISEPAAALELLERALNAERRPEEAIVVSELRAIAGELDEGRHAWLRARSLPPFEQHHTAIDRSTLVSHVVPAEGRHLLLDIAAAISGVETKIFRADLGELGIGSRDRIGKRSGHPTRLLLDRLCRALGITDVELVIAPTVARVRVLAQDALWIVVPKSLTELPEPAQLASIGRALARVALNVPWLEELPPPHMEAMLLAAARAVNPAYGKDDIDVQSLKLAMQYEPNLAKELSRKQKQALEKLVPRMGTPQGRLIGIDVLIGALARAELRIAYVLTGDVLATIDELRGLDSAFLHATDTPGRGSLSAVLDHPFAGDVVRFALTPEATALRRRIGSTWTG